MPNLDRYEEAGLEEEVYEDITDEERIRQRIEAERELDRRDAEEGRVTGRRRLPGALYGKNSFPPIILNSLVGCNCSLWVLLNPTGKALFEREVRKTLVNY